MSPRALIFFTTLGVIASGLLLSQQAARAREARRLRHGHKGAREPFQGDSGASVHPSAGRNLDVSLTSRTLPF